MKNILMIIVLLSLALLAYKISQTVKPTTSTATNIAIDTSNVSTSVSTSTDFDDIPPTYVDSDIEIASAPIVKPILNPETAAPSFTCDGRQHCSQMTSCAEATYFSNNCPNTKMDGNNDGIPCEQQWCN